MNEELLLEDHTISQTSFLEYRVLMEGFRNFLPSDTTQKEKHASEVHAMVTKAYADQGGIKGNGFSSPEDMVKHIPMWKVAKHQGTIKAVALYKDKTGRKRVAMASDGTPEGKKSVGDMVMADLKMSRSHMEVSGKSLSFMKRHVNIEDHIHSYESAEKYHAAHGDTISRPEKNDPEVVRHPELKDHMYTRTIGGHTHTKVMLGTTGKPITEDMAEIKAREKAAGEGSALKPGKHQYGKWEMDTQIHGPARARERQPSWKEHDWHDFLSRSHEALSDPSKHVSKPAKVTHDSVLVYSKKKQQGVILRVVPKDRASPKQGGSTRIETILPHAASIAKEGTQRIVIENILYIEGENLIIIE